jgi:hypothetical protein
MFDLLEKRDDKAVDAFPNANCVEEFLPNVDIRFTSYK